MSHPLYQQAIGAARQGRFEAAAAAAGELVRREPENADGWSLSGQLKAQLGDPAGALEAFDRALALREAHAPTHVNRGVALATLGRHAEAAASFERAVALQPQLAPAHANRAEALNALGRHAEAVEAARAALALQPAYANAWSHLGTALYGLGRLEESLDAYRAALRADPKVREGLCNVGMVLTALARETEALEAFDAAAADPAQAPLARYRRAHVRLALGDFAGGWDDYEHRWDAAFFNENSAGYVTPRLRERLTVRPRPADLAGRRVLLVAEQGVGDQIMFASILPDLMACAAAVRLACDPRLVGLFAHSFPGLEVIGGGRDLSAEGFDHVLAMGSLGYAFRPSPEAFPRRPYLTPRPQVVEAWRARLGPAAGRRPIGLSWRGGTARTGAAARSLPVEALRPLLALPDCDFVSLQYGDAAADIAAAGGGLPPIRLFPPDAIDDFEQLAGLVCALDQVVSVQTSVIHLAGATGRPCQVMIPKKAEWRYGAAGESMAWYGSVRLIRQREDEPFARVVDRAARAVAEGLAGAAA